LGRGWGVAKPSRL